MGKAVEMICGQATAPGATLTALTMAAGNSLTVRNCDFAKQVRLVQMWSDCQAAGIFRVRSPKMHDNVQGIRQRVTVSDVVPLLPEGVSQKLIPQDQLIAEISGSAVGGQFEGASMLIYYEDLPGTAARLYRWADILPAIANMVDVEVSLVTGAGGGYTGEVALNSSFDLLKANTDYALLGYMVNLECLSVGFRGADTGNFRLGGPGNETLRHVTNTWFKRLSIAHDLPLIPVFNSANKAGFLIDAVEDQAAGTVIVNLCLAELTPGQLKPAQ